MHRTAFLILTLCPALIASGACSNRADHQATPGAVAPGARAASAPARSRPTDRADAPVVAVAMWPSRWPALVQALESAGQGTLLDDALHRADLSSPWPAIELAGRAVGLTLAPGPLPGIDPRGAMVLELFPAEASFEESALAAWTVAQHGARPTQSLGLRARLTLPARDPAALAGAIQKAARSSGFTGAAGGGVVWSDRALLRVGVVSGAVIVDAVPGTALARIQKDVRVRLLGPAPTAAPVPGFALAGDSALRLIVRARRLGELGAAMGEARSLAAAGEVEADMRDAVVLAGLSEVLSGYLLMDPWTSVADALLIDVPAGAGQAPQAALALSSAGQGVVKAAGLARATRTPVARLDWRKAVVAAPLSPILDRTRSTSAAAELVQVSGWPAWPYLALGNAAGFGHVFARSGELDELMAGAGRYAGLERLGAVSLWLDDGVVSFVRGGDAARLTQAAPRSAAAGAERAADQCYRRALLDVTTTLRSTFRMNPAERQAALEASLQALAGTQTCVSSRSRLTRRRDALSRLITELAKPAR